MPQLKTPGVYIKEENAFPTSVVEVETAVPAFIGYTEKAARGNTNLTNTPTRISSLGEYHLYFGGAPKTIFRKKASESHDKTKVGGSGQAAPGTPAFEATPETRFLLYHSMRLFFDNGGGPCWITSLGSFASAVGTRTADAFTAAIDALAKEQEPTMIVTPDTVLLSIDDWQKVAERALAHCIKMQSRIAILDVYDGNKSRTYAKDDVVMQFRNKITSDFPSYGVAYYPWVNSSIVEDGEINFTFLDKDAWNDLQKDVKKSLGESFAPIGALLGKVSAPAVATTTDPNVVKVHQALMVASPEYRELMADLKQLMNVLPPSAGIAGVYTRIDNTMGVFKAPANTGMASVVSPTVNITHDDQADLNIPLDGKAINAIRTFPGRGLLIWGARTLDGNSQDWRYVNVRRTLIMLEQSVKNAAQAYVFAPNDAATWTTVSNTIGNFLNNKWKEGALVGATPPEAFSVDVGLGSTMTANDILDGYMLVTVKVALVRPAEFIVITFQQKMQTS